MTTRWHWQNTAPAVSPAYSAAWAVTASAVRMAQGTGNGIGVTASETSATPINVLGVQVVTDALAAGPIAGTFRLAVMSGNAQSTNAFLRVRLRLVDSTGAEKAVLLDATDATALPLGSTQTVTAYSADLTPATAVAGDRLALEYGAFMNNTATTSRSINWGSWTSGNVDHAFADGGTTSGKPWFEIEPPPIPDPPTALHQTAATPTTVSVAWTAAAGGTPATGYDLRVDGGAPTALGLVTSHTVTGLDPDTGYTVEVRATTATDASTWVSVVASTDPLPPPDAPTGLTQTGATVYTVDVGWTPAAGGTPATGYDLRVDGGAPTALGLTTTAALAGLDPDTGYTVEVRATAPEGASAWVSVVATTDELVASVSYSAHLRVGVHEWDITTEDAPGYGPLAGLRFAWTARPDDGWPTQHDPTTMVFGVIVEAGTDFDDVDQGTDVHFTFTPDGYTAPLLDYGGTVRDLVGRPHSLGMVYEITAVDHLQKLMEDYTTSLFVENGDPVTDFWEKAVLDADGAGAGTGTRPALPDPLAGLPVPGHPAGTAGGDVLVEDVPTWSLLTGILAAFTGNDSPPLALQRAILSYQLDVDGNLDSAQPFVGTWLEPASAAGPVAVDGRLLVTGATEWSRPRLEPNVVVTNPDGFSGTFERPHPGVDIVRAYNASGPAFLSDVTDPNWVLEGTEGTDQWSTELRMLAARDPLVVEGWFTLPTAMGTYVHCENVDPRHTPTGSGVIEGSLAAASLVIPAGGDWGVTFYLRRTIPADHP